MDNKEQQEARLLEFTYKAFSYVKNNKISELEVISQHISFSAKFE